MTTIALPIASMLVLTLLAWLATRSTRLAICPACAGVAGTWLWMLAARAAGVAIDVILLAALLGASATGVTQWLADRLPAGRSAILWKALTLPVACALAYGIAAEHWILAAGAGLAYAILALRFQVRSRAAKTEPALVSQLEERMKKCC